MIAGEKMHRMSNIHFSRYCASGFKSDILRGNSRFSRHQRIVRVGRKAALRMYPARRAYQAMNCMDQRIWANKPRFFNGRAALARRANMGDFLVWRWLYVEVPF